MEMLDALRLRFRESVAQEPKRKRPKTTPSATRSKRAADTPATRHAATTRLSENLATMAEIAARIRVHRHAESGLQSGLHPGCEKLGFAAVAARADFNRAAPQTKGLQHYVYPDTVPE